MADAPPELWIARHGDTAWTGSRQHTGRTDSSSTRRARRRRVRWPPSSTVGTTTSCCPARCAGRARPRTSPASSRRSNRPAARVRLRRVRGHHHRRRSTRRDRTGTCGRDGARAGRRRPTWAGAWTRSWRASAAEARERALVFGHGHALRDAHRALARPPGRRGTPLPSRAGGGRRARQRARRGGRLALGSLTAPRLPSGGPRVAQGLTTSHGRGCR